MKIFEFWKSYFYALLLHPTEPKILLQVNKGHYGLPLVEINKGIWLSDVQPVKNAIKQNLGLSVNILHYAHYQVNQKQRHIKGIYVIESRDPSEEIKLGNWYDIQTIKSLSLTNSEHQSIIEKYLIERETGNIPKLRPSWAQHGWFSEVSTWIDQQLEKLEYQRIAPIEYVKNWSISCILKVKTTGGTMYLKEASSCLPLFCHEPTVTAELASLFPQHIPNIISIDHQRHWMLLGDFGKSLNHVPWEKKGDIYRLFAQIQIQSVPNCDRLLSVGCLDRRLHTLQSQIDPLMNDEEILSKLSTEEIKQLQNLAPYLKNLCQKLASYKIPQTLVHGDLHLGNVALSQNNYVFFDWTDSCISHPFFDMFDLLLQRTKKSWLRLVQNIWKQKNNQRLRDQYLSQWRQYETMERLLDAWEIAKPLCALHHSVSYQNIFHGLESRSQEEFKRAIPYFLREIIRLSSSIKS